MGSHGMPAAADRACWHTDAVRGGRGALPPAEAVPHPPPNHRHLPREVGHGRWEFQGRTTPRRGLEGTRGTAECRRLRPDTGTGSGSAGKPEKPSCPRHPDRGCSPPCEPRLLPRPPPAPGGEVSQTRRVSVPSRQSTASRAGSTGTLPKGKTKLFTCPGTPLSGASPGGIGGIAACRSRTRRAAR